jgi:hypothetical protein
MGFTVSFSFSVNILQLCEIIRLIVKETHTGITRCLQKVRYHVSKFHIFVKKKQERLATGRSWPLYQDKA